MVLLPDADGKTGVVAIRNETSAVELNQPYASVSVSDVKQEIKVETAEKKAVEKNLEKLITVEPPKPKLFLLYFDHDSCELTVQSKKLLPVIIQALKEREHAEISIIGR